MFQVSPSDLPYSNILQYYLSKKLKILNWLPISLFLKKKKKKPSGSFLKQQQKSIFFFQQDTLVYWDGFYPLVLQKIDFCCV